MIRQTKDDKIPFPFQYLEQYYRGELPWGVAIDNTLDEVNRLIKEYIKGLSLLSAEDEDLLKEDVLNDSVVKIECSVEDFKRLGYTDEEAQEIFGHINIWK